LQHRAVGFPFTQARRLIEAELGCPREQVFDEFDEVPMAAASICQVHSARLRKEQARVAVKVQRPDIATKFGRDMTMLRLLVFLREVSVRLRSAAGGQSVADVFRKHRVHVVADAIAEIAADGAYAIQPDD
jgi:ubiquinone biosynthesis protein